MAASAQHHPAQNQADCQPYPSSSIRSCEEDPCAVGGRFDGHDDDVDSSGLMRQKLVHALRQLAQLRHYPLWVIEELVGCMEEQQWPFEHEFAFKLEPNRSADDSKSLVNGRPVVILTRGEMVLKCEQATEEQTRVECKESAACFPLVGSGWLRLEGKEEGEDGIGLEMGLMPTLAKVTSKAGASVFVLRPDVFSRKMDEILARSPVHEISLQHVPILARLTKGQLTGKGWVCTC